MASTAACCSSEVSSFRGRGGKENCCGRKIPTRITDNQTPHKGSRAETSMRLSAKTPFRVREGGCEHQLCRVRFIDSRSNQCRDGRHSTSHPRSCLFRTSLQLETYLVAASFHQLHLGTFNALVEEVNQLHGVAGSCLELLPGGSEKNRAHRQLVELNIWVQLIRCR